MNWLENGPVLCVFRRTTGLPCPGCGMTRATYHLLGGRFREAADSNPLAPLVLAIAAVELAKRTTARHVLEKGQNRIMDFLHRIPEPVRRIGLALGIAGWLSWVVSRWRPLRAGRA